MLLLHPISLLADYNYFTNEIPVNCLYGKKSTINNGYGEWKKILDKPEGNAKYIGNFKEYKMHGYGELNCYLKSKTSTYKGNFKDGSFSGLGFWESTYNSDIYGKRSDKYIGYFVSDRFSGKGIYINKDWIVNAIFEYDTVKYGTYYGCNRKLGNINKSVRIIKNEASFILKQIVFKENNPKTLIITNQNAKILSIKEKLTELYYYKGPVDNKCNGGFFEAIKSFMEDEELNVDYLIDNFFIMLLDENIFKISIKDAINNRIE